MLEKWEQVTEDEILYANIVKYNDDNIVNYYTDSEEPRYSYYEYEVILQAVINVLQPILGRSIRAVDMCGGAGKAAFVIKKCDASCNVTLVDVSDKMLGIARDKARKQGIADINIVQDDAFNFLANEGNYDLMVFSSAIHHFKDPQKLLSAAANKLSSEGMIVTIADPTTLIKSRRYKFLEFLVTNREAKRKAINGMVSRIFSAELKREASLNCNCDIAEYQTFKGIDDKQLSLQLSTQGLYPLVHLRYPAGEPFMLRIMPMIGLNWAFSMILRPGYHENNIKFASDLRKQIRNGLPYRISFL